LLRGENSQRALTSWQHSPVTQRSGSEQSWPISSWIGYMMELPQKRQAPWSVASSIATAHLWPEWSQCATMDCPGPPLLTASRKTSRTMHRHIPGDRSRRIGPASWMPIPRYRTKPSRNRPRDTRHSWAGHRHVIPPDDGVSIVCLDFSWLTPVQAAASGLSGSGTACCG
jgi:hypothetical protein